MLVTVSSGNPRPPNAVARPDCAAHGDGLATARAELEAARAELAAARAALADLECAVAHDLRAPRRRLRSFAEMLAAKVGGHASPEVAQLAARIRAASDQAGALLDGLAELARIARQPLVRERVDLTGIAESIVGALGAREPDRAVAFRATPGLTATADPGLVRTLLEHLFGNAWKFTAGVDRARIEFGCEQRPGQAVFFVRDNGCGFDMASADRLFRPFGRLHSTKEFQGTGIGLAVAARIVGRHGGRIWTTAAPGAGATFFFTLPTPEQHPDAVDSRP